MLLLWIPLRQRPGFGTVSNVVVIGVAGDASLALVPTLSGLGVRAAFLVCGIVLNALAGALYIGARLGPGPRDGLMTGLSRRTGRSIRLVRTVQEVAVVGIGVLLGGSVGLVVGGATTLDEPDPPPHAASESASAVTDVSTIALRIMYRYTIS